MNLLLCVKCASLERFHKVPYVILRWPTTVTSNTNYSNQIQNPDNKYKLLTSKTNCSHQIQITHIKYKILTSNTNYSHQIHKLLTSNTNYSHQIQKPDIKNKIKRSAVGERKLCPVFNLVPRAFPIEIGRGGKRPWHRLVT